MSNRFGTGYPSVPALNSDTVPRTCAGETSDREQQRGRHAQGCRNASMIPNAQIYVLYIYCIYANYIQSLLYFRPSPLIKSSCQTVVELLLIREMQHLTHASQTDVIGVQSSVTTLFSGVCHLGHVYIHRLMLSTEVSLKISIMRLLVLFGTLLLCKLLAGPESSIYTAAGLEYWKLPACKHL